MHPDGFRLVQFCHHLHDRKRARRFPTMRGIRLVGRGLVVDLAGMTMTVLGIGPVPSSRRAKRDLEGCEGTSFIVITDRR